MNKYFHDQKVKNLIYLVKTLTGGLQTLIEFGEFSKDFILADLIDRIELQIVDIEKEFEEDKNERN